MSEVNNNFSIDFIGIGARKCATTWIFACLKEHPEICSSSEKEIHFFNRDSKYKQGTEFYGEHFEHCPKDTIKGEFSTGYLMSKKAPQRIYEHYPNTKLIVSLRDPIERAYSHYRWAKRMKMREGVYNTFREAVKEDDKIVRLGKYYKGMKKYLQLFPRKNIHIILYQDLKKKPVPTIQNTYNFLEIGSDYKPDQVLERKNLTGAIEKKRSLQS